MKTILQLCVAIGWTFSPILVFSLTLLDHDRVVDRRRALQSALWMPIMTIMTTMDDATAAMDENITTPESNCQTQCVYECESSKNTQRKRKGSEATCQQRCHTDGDDYAGSCHDDPPPPQVREPKLQQSHAIPGLYHRWQDEYNRAKP